MLPSLFYGLLSALAFGGSDVLVASLTRRYSVLLTLVVVQAVGCVVFLLFVGGALLRSSAWSPAVLLESVVLWVVTTLAYLCFYAALKKGPLALVSPISASYGAITVSLAFVVFHEAIAISGRVGIGLVLCGTVLASIPVGTAPGSHTKPPLIALIFSQGTALAILAMVGFGLELFFLSSLSKVQGPVLPVITLQGFMLVVLTPFALAGRDRPRAGLFKMPLRWGGMMLLCGLLNAAGLLLYTVGVTQGITSVVALLSSAYSLLPLLVGVVFLRERLSRLQGIGVAGLLIGVVLLSAFQSV